MNSKLWHVKLEMKLKATKSDSVKIDVHFEMLSVRIKNTLLALEKSARNVFIKCSRNRCSPLLQTATRIDQLVLILRTMNMIVAITKMIP